MRMYANHDAEPLLNLAPSRRRGLMRQVLAAPDSARQVQILRNVADVVRESVPEEGAARALYAYRVKESKVSEQWADNPVERTLIVRLPFSTGGPTERSRRGGY